MAAAENYNTLYNSVVFIKSFKAQKTEQKRGENKNWKQNKNKKL